MEIGYRIVERFTPAHDGWAKYVDWSGLSHLEEVVGLDCCLCPSVIKTYVADDREHLVFAEHLFACFDDQEYATGRVTDALNVDLHQILALAREPPEEELIALDLACFRFMGFDLIEEATCISALTNCGGFEGVFLPTDLSPQGLVPAAARAYEIRRSLGTLFPNEPHANCAIWAVWRRVEQPVGR